MLTRAERAGLSGLEGLLFCLLALVASMVETQPGARFPEDKSQEQKHASMCFACLEPEEESGFAKCDAPGCTKCGASS
eukprot:10866640-Alexandrium_andersonii.AAC.1